MPPIINLEGLFPMAGGEAFGGGGGGAPPWLFMGCIFFRKSQSSWHQFFFAKYFILLYIYIYVFEAMDFKKGSQI